MAEKAVKRGAVESVGDAVPVVIRVADIAEAVLVVIGTVL